MRMPHSTGTLPSSEGPSPLPFRRLKCQLSSVHAIQRREVWSRHRSRSLFTLGRRGRLKGAKELRQRLNPQRLYEFSATRNVNCLIARIVNSRRRLCSSWEQLSSSMRHRPAGDVPMWMSLDGVICNAVVCPLSRSLWTNIDRRRPIWWERNSRFVCSWI